METKTQSHCWWFESHNSSNCSPWLQSTLSELNEKTKTMLKLVEEDADSFAQRAEMYYKKRPELISMVEDFYRAHRSLAERYDQLKSDRAVRIRSPLSQSLSLPKMEHEYVFDSLKSFDSFTDGAYSSEESVESEVDDPEEEDYAQSDQDEVEIGKPFSAGDTYNELTKLRDELDCLREENEMQKNIIKQKDEEKEEFLKRLSDKIREVNGAVRDENMVVLKKTSKLSVPFNEMTKLKDETEKLKMENSYLKEEVKKKVEDVVEVTKMFEETKSKLMKLEQEEQLNNGNFKNALAVKEEQILEITRQFEVTKSELVKLNAALVGKEAEIRHLKDTLVVKDDENCETIKQLNGYFTEKDMENKAIKQLKFELADIDAEKNETIRCLRDANLENDAEKNELIRKLKDKLAEIDEEKNEAIRRLKDAIIQKDIQRNDAVRQLNNALEEKDEETCEVIRQLNNALEEKDEEKREAIRQLSIAMELLREESRCLKKTLVNVSPRKKSVDFQILKGVNLGKLFKLSSSCEASVL